MRRRRGITLIEVTAALALLAVLLTSLLVAKQRQARQWSTANRKLQAVHAAERLLNTWWPPHPTTPPPHRQGRGRSTVVAAMTSLDDNPLASDLAIHDEGFLDDDLAWRLTERSGRNADRWGARIVRLEITDERDPSTDAPVLTAVDLLIPMPHAEALQ